MSTFEIDRVAVVDYYTPIDRNNGHEIGPGVVFAESDTHFNAEWICLGFVSKQTPLGQGIYCGFHKDKVRKATAEEIRLALSRNHPFGEKFRPASQKLRDASFHLVMAEVVANWTTDGPSQGAEPVLPISKQSIRDFMETEANKHEKIMAAWAEITAAQAKANMDFYTVGV